MQDHVGPFKSVFEYLAVKDSDSEQLGWWKRQVTKSLIRKYVDYIKNEQILEVVPTNVKDIVGQYLAVRPIVPRKKVIIAEPKVEEDQPMADAAAKGVTEATSAVESKETKEAETAAEPKEAEVAESKEAESAAEPKDAEPAAESNDKDETMQE